MEDRNARGPRAGAEPGGLSPGRAFILLGLVGAAIAAGVTAFRDPAPAEPRPAAAPSPDYSLTDAEALAEFERLNDQLMLAYRERSVALAEDVFTADSPMLPRVRKEIDDLVDSSVISRTRFEAMSTGIITNTPSRVVLRRVETLYPRFTTEGGDDATGASSPERRVVRWELHEKQGRWLLHNAVVTARRMGTRGGRQ